MLCIYVYTQNYKDLCQIMWLPPMVSMVLLTIEYVLIMFKLMFYSCLTLFTAATPHAYYVIVKYHWTRNYVIKGHPRKVKQCLEYVRNNWTWNGPMEFRKGLIVLQTSEWLVHRATLNKPWGNTPGRSSDKRTIKHCLKNNLLQ